MKQQRSTLEKRHALEEGQKRVCCGSTELAIVVARRSWREISLWKIGDRHKNKKTASVSTGPTTTINSKLVSGCNPP
jgi:hypothetical protein